MQHKCKHKHRVIYRRSLILQEDWHKAHWISRNFGLIVLDSTTQTSPTCNYLGQSNFFHPKRDNKKKSISEIEEKKIVHVDILKTGCTKHQLLCTFWKQRWCSKICRCVKYPEENSLKSLRYWSCVTPTPRLRPTPLQQLFQGKAKPPNIFISCYEKVNPQVPEINKQSSDLSINL